MTRPVDHAGNDMAVRVQSQRDLAVLKKLGHDVRVLANRLQGRGAVW